MFGLGTGELVLIGIVVFILVGPKKIPQLGSSVAQGIRNFKMGMTGAIDDNNTDSPNKTSEKTK